MRILLLTTSFLFGFQFAHAQKWAELLLMGERDFEKIQRAFYEEWDGKAIERGTGYKQYKRWEAFMLPRLVDGKSIPNPASSYSIRAEEFNHPSTMRVIATSAWQPLGPYSWVNGPHGYNPGVGRINCIDIHPNDPNTLFVGTPAGGLWKTTNGGGTWTSLSDGLAVLGVTDFYIDADNPDLMYLLTGDAYGTNTYSVGVLKSTDGGATWSNTSNFNPAVSSGYRMFKMLVDPTNNQKIIIGGNGGIWVSTNGGNSWTQHFDQVVVDLEFKPDDPSVVYASQWGNNVFYKSINGGLDWSSVLTGASGQSRTVIGVSPDEPDYVYILASSPTSTFGGVYLSTNAGESFTLMSNSPNIFGYSPSGNDNLGQGWYDLAIAVNPNDADDIYVSGIHIWNSKDGGASWQDEHGIYRMLNYWIYNPGNSGRYVHADNHTLDFLGGNLYAGCDGGIWKTTNLGQSWTDLSFGLNITQFYRLGQDPNDASVIVAGAQDNGTNVYRNGTWTHIYGADGMEALVDHTNGSVVYGSSQSGGLNRFTSWGNGTRHGIKSNINENGDWITPYVMHPSQNDVLFAGYQNVWKSENQGNSWTKLSDFGSTERLRSLVVSSADPNYIYAASGYNIYMSSDGGQNWTSINNGLPSQYMTYLAVSENDPETIWATFSGYSNNQKVYQSTNAGTTWTNISSGLPNVPANCIVHLKDSDGQLYVGTDVGVFQRDASMTQWMKWSEELPNVIVNELEVHYQSYKIRAATFGRGIWERDLNGRIEIEEILADNTTIERGETVTYSVNYTGDPESFQWSFPGGTPSTSTEPNPTIQYNTAGKYSVTLQLFGINTPRLTISQFIEVIYIPLGIDDTGQFSIYPNPTSGILNIDLKNTNTVIQVMDIQGRMLKAINFDRKGIHQLELSDLPDGMLIIRMVSPNGEKSFKVIKN
jgi:photosystem II stability/assembly factor-like uncharacterized protein